MKIRYFHKIFNISNQKRKEILNIFFKIKFLKKNTLSSQNYFIRRNPKPLVHAYLQV
jgi:hypothetical protein